MKPIVGIYHKNPQVIYPREWIDACLRAHYAQSYSDFHFVELDYGASNNFLVEDSRLLERFSYECENFAAAANTLLDFARDVGAPAFFNVHIDDGYSTERLAIQMHYINQGFDLVSSNFTAIDEQGLPFFKYPFDERVIAAEFGAGHNVICNPVVAFGRRWLEEGGRYEPSEVPFEDFELWKREINRMRFVIVPEWLCEHRSHVNEVSKGHQE